MNNTKFLRELKDLIYYVREYGIRHVNFDIKDKAFYEKNVEKVDEFYLQCHQGFYAAQDRAIYILKKLLLEQKRLKSTLAEARRQHNKEDASEINQQFRRAKFQECVLRKLMDSIAWQLFNYDLSSMRRLYCGEPPIDITNSNIDSELSYIGGYKKEHPGGFVLISDLTSFIQIGDVVTVNKTDGIRISELKEGTVNEQIFEIIENVSKTNCPKHLQLELEDKNKLFLQQFERAVKQIKKTNQVYETIRTGYGNDLFTGQKVRIVQGDFQPETYEKTLHFLAENCHKKGYAISVVEECLLIGVYDTEKFPSQVFDAWTSMIKVKTPTYDLRASFFDPLSYPVFLHGFSDTFIMDLISGKKVVKMALNIEKWLNTFEEDGCTVRWLSKKETGRINSRMNHSNKIFGVDGRGVEIEKNGAKHIVGQGIFSRLFSGFLMPSSARQLLLAMSVDENTPADMAIGHKTER